MADEEVSLDDKIWIEGIEGHNDVISYRKLQSLKGVTCNWDISNTLKNYMIANVNATRYGTSKKPMDVSEIVPLDLLVQHNVTGGRGYDGRSPTRSLMKIFKRYSNTEDTESALQNALKDMDEHDRRINAVCQHISDIVSEKCSLRRQK